VTPALKHGKFVSIHMVNIHTSTGSTDAGKIVSQIVGELVVPVVILIIIASIISIYIMKRLLNSIDHELYELESRLKFIDDGDINIEIIQHKGTKDIKLLYDEVRIINKLHRYSTEHYFRGYFTEKILKYNEALQFIKGLGYDTGNVLENMGEAAMYAEEW
jgi:hypothetical protein